eukprot:4474986-Pyramimonas_sp.AAC.1
METFPFKLKAPMLVLEEIVKLADIRTHRQRLRPGARRRPSEISFLSGGVSIGLAPLDRALPPAPLLDVSKTPGYLAPAPLASALTGEWPGADVTCATRDLPQAQ